MRHVHWNNPVNPEAVAWARRVGELLGYPMPDVLLFADWDESKHKRGQPENKGQFGPGGGGGQSAKSGEGGGVAPAPYDPQSDPALQALMEAEFGGREEKATADKGGSSATAGQSSEEQAAQDWQENGTKAKAFKDWFGDWENDPGSASKVVDAYSGEPKDTYEMKRVFHGTDASFESFDPEKKGSHGAVTGHGFYFAEDRRVAESYAQGGGKILETYLNIRNPFDFDDVYGRTSINQFIDAALKHSPSLDPNDARRELQRVIGGKMRPDGTITGVDAHKAIAGLLGKERVNDILATAGYDGVTHKSRDIGGSIRMRNSQEDYGRIWVAFEPTQIKSTNNRGTFDPADPRIAFADLFALDSNPHRRSH